MVTFGRTLLKQVFAEIYQKNHIMRTKLVQIITKCLHMNGVKMLVTI